MAATTRVLGTTDVVALLRQRGAEKVLDELIERLRDALAGHDPATTDSPARAGFDAPADGGGSGLLEWMPVLERGRVAALKTVAYHPTNPARRSLPSVVATTNLFEPGTGRLLAVVDATLLTALRTGAASAVASDVLAVDGPLVLGVVGAGAQAVTQVHALSRVRRIERVLVVDVDPAAAASFGRRTRFLDRPVEVVAPEERDRLLAEADVLCTCTSVPVGAGPVLGDVAPRPWLHVNAVGSDFPGKQELPLDLLRRSLLVPDLVAQCLVEGESQWVDRAHLGPDLATVIQQRDRWVRHRSSLTVFDSTGWALEDLVAAELFLDLARLLGVGTTVEVQATGSDPLDPYGAPA